MRLPDSVDEELLELARPCAVPGPRPTLPITLELAITDPEVLAELWRRSPGGEREEFALAALRLGVLSLRMASGQVDADAIREAGQKLVSDLRELFSARAADMTGAMATILTQYFDPGTGLLPQKLSGLLSSGGELERVLRAHLGSDGSVLAQTLATHLRDQTHQVLAEFSLDNDQSVLSRLGRLLQATSEQIGKNLTLDDERSALSRLRRELGNIIEDLVRRNGEFHAEVRATLAALETRRKVEAQTTRHGAVFEDELGTLLRAEAQRLGDVHQATGSTTGAIRNCKIGDHVIELGPESPAPGSRVAWEAKDDRGYDLRKALAEIDEARRNRQAQLGVFVFSRRCAPEGLEVLTRYKDDLVVIWDADDPASDLVVRAAYGVTRALAIRERAQAAEAGEAWSEIDHATRAIEKQVKYLEDIERMAVTIRNNGQNIAERAGRMRVDVAKEVARLDEKAAALKR